MIRNKKELKYIALLAATVIAFVLVEVLAPDPVNWTITYSKKDKIPYGTYVLHDLFSAYFEDKKVSHSYQTLYEQQDLISDQNIFVLANQFAPDQADAEALLKKVNEGATAFIAANYFSGKFADTLNITVEDYLYDIDVDDLNSRDTTFMELANPSFRETERLHYQMSHFPTYFSSVDTLNASIILQNKNKEVLGIKMKHGNGHLYLCTAPMIFTNNYLLTENNDQVVSGLLSYLPNKDIIWSEYYHLGRMESGSSIRFILSNPALKWAYYICLVGLLILFFFETKRRQRAIPIVKPYPNTSLEFVGVIGNLYLQNNDHKKIAEKRVSFFLEQVRQRYYLQKISFDESFYQVLADKSGNTLKSTTELFEDIQNIHGLTSITGEHLQQLSMKIDQFS
jgi:hypothetical protein